MLEIDERSTAARQESLRWRARISHEWGVWFTTPLEPPIKMAFEFFVLFLETVIGAFRHTIIGKTLVASGALAIFGIGIWQVSAYFDDQRQQRINTAWSTITLVATSQNTRKLRIGNVGLGSALRTLALEDVVLAELNLATTYLRAVRLPEGTYLTGSNFRGANLIYANICGGRLKDTDFRDAKLSAANLRDTLLVNANFSNADLSGADLSYAFANKALFVEADLSRADLSNATFGESDFGRSALVEANFSGARLGFSKFNNADLKDAKFNGTDLTGTDFAGAKGWVAKQFAVAITGEPKPTGLPPEVLRRIKPLRYGFGGDGGPFGYQRSRCK